MELLAIETLFELKQKNAQTLLTKEIPFLLIQIFYIVTTEFHHK